MAPQPGGTQPSISSFFTKTPAKRPAPSGPSASTSRVSSSPEVVDITDEADEDVQSSKKPRLNEVEDEDGLNQAAGSLSRGKDSRSRETSAFFGGSRSTPALNSTQAAAASAARRKAILDAAAPPARAVLSRYKARTDVVGAAAAVGRSGGAFEDYSLGVPASQPAEEQAATSSQRDEAARARHAEWQRRTGSMSGLIPRRRSLPLEEAAARAAAQAARGEDGTGDEEALAMSDAEDAEVQIQGPKGKAAGAAKAKGKGKKAEVLGPSGLPYTPLEKQFMEIKEADPDVLLFTEVGYKFKFHGDDAKIASRELGIACFPQRNFFVASIPTHRLHIHVKKLVAQGHKVGVVRQTETAALKAAGDNRNQPFKRELTNLYTAATYVDDSSIDDLAPGYRDSLTGPGSAPPSLVCLREVNKGGMGADERVQVYMLAVVLQTGEVVYDDFESGHLRSELETRLVHLAPSEILLPEKSLSRPTEKLIQYFVANSRAADAPGIRLERRAFCSSYQDAFENVSLRIRARQAKHNGNGVIDVDEEDAEASTRRDTSGSSKAAQDDRQDDASDAIGKLADLPRDLVIVLEAAVKHLHRFKLSSAVLHFANYKKFSARAHMILSADSLQNLEIYANSTDYTERGSLLSLLDRTKTKMGKRLLREWIGRPLTSAELLAERFEAISEIKDGGSSSICVAQLQGLLRGMPDLQRGLCRIQYRKASSGEVAALLGALHRLAREFAEGDSNKARARLIRAAMASFPDLKTPVERFLGDMDPEQARAGNLANMFVNPDKYPLIQDAKEHIALTTFEMNEHLKEIRKILKRPGLSFITVAGVDFLIEVRLKESVPDQWVKMSSTKSMARYHTPKIIELMKDLERAKETLQAEAIKAFDAWQGEIAEEYGLFRQATAQLATFDCLQSLASVAASVDYTQPDICDDTRLIIRDGRHPMAENLRDEPYVPNTAHFGARDDKVMVITGPNMAGKSSFVRATALILVMAQIGSFVPASTAQIGLHDAIFTRMGASDDLARGQSTFMVELSETSEILRKATSRSLVICDELGRGTSTHDGTAIAYGVLDRLADMGCNTMFITHFPNVAVDVVRKSPQHVGMFHMSFEESSGQDGSSEITFTYRMIPGIAHRSFGVWVARLAGLPQEVLEIADRKSAAMRRRGHKNLIEKCLSGQDIHLSLPVRETVALLERVNAIDA